MKSEMRYWKGEEGLERGAKIVEEFIKEYGRRPRYDELKEIASEFVAGLTEGYYKKFGIYNYRSFIVCYLGIGLTHEKNKFEKRKRKAEREELFTQLAQFLLEGVEPSEEDKKRMRKLGMIK
jgi:hypothetical protein